MPIEPDGPNQTAPPPTPEKADEKITFTEEELREMDAEGLTLGDAIREIEAQYGVEP